MPNIYDIARKAGVSPSTVARALRGTGYCSPEKKELVQRIADEMNYNPTHAAKTLKSNRTQKILFCIPDIYNPFYFKMIKGASDVLEQNGYFPVLCHTKGLLELELKMIQNLCERYGDGMILVSFNFSRDNIGAVNSSRMPVVLTNHYESEDSSKDTFDYVYIDTHEGIRMATLYLAGLGHRRIAYLGGKKDTQTGQERLQGYLDAMSEEKLSVTSRYVLSSDYTSAGGEAVARELLRADPKPTAIVCANDLMAFGVLKVCHEYNLRVPQDISLIGMDNTETASWSSPQLTSVTMREEEIGHFAGRFLMERILDGRKKRKTMRLMPDIQERESCGPCLSPEPASV